jgi:glycerophosphoryl diester phosphodiesterase
MIRSSLLPALLLSMLPAHASESPFVIAHRGASGYLPEHTLEAAAAAHAMGADYIEQDVVLSRDGVLVVLHDIHVDTTTDVARKFPHRSREDGRYYAIDFDWAELSQLTVRERFNPRTDEAVFSSRFPASTVPFRLSTMEQQLQLIAGLNQSTGRHVGWCPEIKAPAWHRAEGQEIGRALIELLARYGYEESTSPVIVQCFEPAELKHLRQKTGTQLRFLQLIGLPEWRHPVDYTPMLTPAGLAEIAAYAQAIGPHLSQVLDFGKGRPSPTDLTQAARQAGLLVIPYTLRLDALPKGTDAKALWSGLRDAAVDGIFSDQPDFRRRLGP